MTRRLVLLYPFLYAALRVLQVADDNPGQMTLTDLWVVLAAAVGLMAIIYGLAAVVTRWRWNGHLAAFLTFLAALVLFSREQLRALGLRKPLEPSLIALGVALGAGVLLLTWWLAHRPATLRKVGTFLTLTGALLVLRFGAGVALDRLRAREVVAESSLADALAQPIAAPPTVPGPRRDVYLLVLDEYANSAVLRERFGFDNRPFEDSLRALGFDVPRVVRSNYTETMFSLPTLLNAAHVYPVERELPPRGKDPTLLTYLLGHSRVAAFLKERGYRFVFFPSAWFSMTASSPLADSTVQVWRGFQLERELSRTEFRRAIRRETLLEFFASYHAYGDHMERSLAAFQRLPAIEGPVFGFAHVVSPHWPYLFDRRCRDVPPARAEGNRPDSYIGQIQCLNHLILGVVNRLIRDSKVPPVIVLQGDHGTSLLKYHSAPTAREVPAAAARERFGAFGAYYLPDGGDEAFGDTVTVVNVMGNVLREYFGARLPPQPDDRYLTVSRAPFDLMRVDPAWLARRDTTHVSQAGARR
jgi:hypothetical protein